MVPSPSPIAVFGADGQLGSALIHLLGKRAVPLTFQEVNLESPETIVPALTQASPAALINAAAYTAVDRAEEDLERAHTVNTEAPGIMARYCANQGIPLVHYSTDYVYAGGGTAPWREEHRPAPRNAYGRSKLAGDEAVLASGAEALIFRTSWVYAPRGNNFPLTMLRLMQERDTLRVVDDQIGAPTYAPHLAEISLAALNAAVRMERFPTGVYHACHSGETSWHGFAETIASIARERGRTLAVRTISPVPTSDYPTPAVRPANSRLDCRKLQETFGLTPPPLAGGTYGIF